ncbi:hypothetical protein ECANGB1_909 [Enterospora canceri]|uniref:Uncharacterized protein n=1 Tax=Enterospora canceri TaxID=1081671 RepID=A0A1Y1S800_9MICR|nr:hypothetical protein ECANGB1_909 [Enterospora canceri]
MQGLPYNKEASLKKEESFKPIPRETLEKLVNPAAEAFSNGLDDFKKTENIEALESLHFVLLMDGSQANGKLLSRLHELVPYMSDTKYYDLIVAMFIDIAHYNQTVQRILIDAGVFKLLNYDNSLTFELIFNICDLNKAGLQQFLLECYNESLSKNPKIMSLLKQL